MILIEEIIPKKVSGRTSLLVSFKYNQGIVEAIKTVPNALYHKKDYTWEIPLSSLSFLLDTLTPLDDIELRLITRPDPDENSPTSLETDLTETEISQFRIRPFDHQIEAINFGLAHPRWLLLDSMGLGKTNEIIWLAETLHRRGLIDHCFIVCGVNSVKQNWKKEIAKFSTESCRILGEKITRTGTVRYATLPDRAAELKNEIEAFFLITNIETLRDDKIIEAFNKSKNSFGMIAVDEIHRCLTGDMIICTDQGNMSLEAFSKLTDSLPKVLSYNKETGQNEFNTVTAINISVPNEPILELRIAENNIIHILKCTQSHKIYTTNRGWVKAKDLTETDDIKIS